MDNDSTLICRAQAGDEGAFVDLIRAYHPFVYAIVVAIVNNPQDAEEIVQDTFLNVYRGLAQYEERAKFKTWLAEIARNRARSWMRKQRIDTVPIDELSLLDEVSKPTVRTQDSPEEQLIRREQSELIRRALGTLSPKEREIARSYYVDGASYDELMSTHGLSYKAISLRLSRAKQKLAKRLGHLLTGVFVSPITTLKQIYSGDVMKVGTVPKITAGAVAVIVLVFIGARQFILSKEDSSPSVEVVTSTESAQSVTQRDATHKGAVTAPSREDKPQISAAEMQQIEDFFAQLDESDAQSETDTSQFSTDTEVTKNTDEHVITDTDAFAEDIEQTAEEVMNAFVEAFKSLNFEAMGALMTGIAKEGFEEFAAMGFPLMDPEELKDSSPEMRQMGEQIFLESISRLEVMNSEYVGDEFHFELGIQPPEVPEIQGMEVSIVAPNTIFKMRKENGVWRIYDSEMLD